MGRALREFNLSDQHHNLSRAMHWQCLMQSPFIRLEEQEVSSQVI